MLGAEIWRQHHKPPDASPNPDGLDWARDKAAQWLDGVQNRPFLKQEKDAQSSEESVIKLRVDDNWNIRALWTGKVKELLVSAGVSLAPTSSTNNRLQLAGPGVSGGGAGMEKRWKGSVGVEVAYSS